MKYKIHLIDDHNLLENTTEFLNLKPLMVESNIKLKTDRERIKLSEKIFDYLYFSRVDDAIEYYEQNGDTSHPDLIIIDISFDGLENTGYSQSHLFTWGVEMGDYANRTFPNTPRIFLSGNSTNPRVLEHLQEKKIKIDHLDLVRKAETFHFKERCSTMLQRRAKYLFELLNENQRIKLWKKIDRKVDLRKDNDISNLKFGIRNMSLRNLLWGYGDINNITLENLLTIVSDILQGIGKDIQFSGEWKSGYVRQMLAEYQESDEYEHTKRNIDIKSLNLLLEILQIREYYKGSEEISLYKNSIRQLCVLCKMNDFEKDKIFEQKMIGRRVVLAFSSLFENGDSIISTDVLCSLLKRGITVDENNDASIDAGNVINTALGLISRRNGGVIRSRHTMLLEEEEWYRNIGKHALAIRHLLDCYDRTAFFSIVHPHEFIDFDDFENAIRAFRISNIKQYPKLINHILNTIDDHNRHILPVMEHLLGIQFK